MNVTTRTHSRGRGGAFGGTGVMSVFSPKQDPAPELDLESYFKIGVSDDYILIRGDFPIAEISPGDFSKLCREMFRRNEEALHNGKQHGLDKAPQSYYGSP